MQLRQFLLLLVIPMASAQATQPSEIDRLRAENAQLRQELEALKTAATKPTTAPTIASTQPVIRRFTTMLEILAKTPDELRPVARPDWYTFTEGKYLDWWKQQLLGLSFEESLQLEECSVGRARTPHPERRLGGVLYPPRRQSIYRTGHQPILEHSSL